MDGLDGLRARTDWMATHRRWEVCAETRMSRAHPPQHAQIRHFPVKDQAFAAPERQHGGSLRGDLLRNPPLTKSTRITRL